MESNDDDKTAKKAPMSDKEWLQILDNIRSQKSKKDPQDRKEEKTKPEPTKEERVADDYEMAMALGMDPAKWKYSQTDSCPPKHLVKLTRQEMQDLSKIVNKHAAAAVYYRKKQDYRLDS